MPPRLFGQPVKCPLCAAEFTAPTGQSDSGAAATTASMPPAEKGEAPAKGAFSCPFCGTIIPPTRKKKIHPAGWALFVVLLVLCFPICWLGFFIREEVSKCSDCGLRLA